MSDGSNIAYGADGEFEVCRFVRPRSAHLERVGENLLFLSIVEETGQHVGLVITGKDIRVWTPPRPEATIHELGPAGEARTDD